jgi:hypothetical protein
MVDETPWPYRSANRTGPKREFIRRGINPHAPEKICGKEAVRAIKLAACLKLLAESEKLIYDGDQQSGPSSPR